MSEPGAMRGAFFAAGEGPLGFELLRRALKHVPVGAARAWSVMGRQTDVAIGVLPERVTCRPNLRRYADGCRSVAHIPQWTVGKDRVGIMPDLFPQ